MSKSTSGRNGVVALLSALALTACSGDEAPEVDAPPPAEQTTEAEPETAEVTSEMAAEFLRVAWINTDDQERTEFCEGIKRSWGTGLADRFAEQFVNMPADVDDQVLFDFRDGACAEHTKAMAEGADDDLFHAFASDWSDEDVELLCGDIDTFGMDFLVAHIREGFESSGGGKSFNVSDQAFEDHINEQCADYEPVAEGSKDSEDWVRDSEDAWFTEAAVHSIWRSSDEGDLERLCEASETLDIEYMARSFATDVLEPVWSEDSPPIDIGAIEDTLTELCVNS